MNGTPSDTWTYDMGQAKETQESVNPPAPRYLYYKCEGYYDAALGRKTGCGRLYTRESDFYLQGRCPHCGEAVKLTALETPAQARRHIGVSGRVGKLIGADCVKCENSVLCNPCFGDSNSAEHCRVCACRQCCGQYRRLCGVLSEGIIKRKFTAAFEWFMAESGGMQRRGNVRLG